MRMTWLVTMALVLTLAGCGERDVARERSTTEAPGAEPPLVSLAKSAPKSASAPKGRPNMVLVLMDDFSMDLLPTMRSAAAMRQAGAFYSNAFVADSFCCPSRAALMTGQYPHQTGVLTNVPGERAVPLGGFDAYAAFGNPERAFNVNLHDAGYTTGFVGKLLNHYEGGHGAPPALPGWSEFEALFGTAYDQWDYQTGTLGRDGQIHVAHHPAPPVEESPEEKDKAYAGVRIDHTAMDFIRRHRDDEAPYYLEVAPYGPHSRTTLRGGAYPGDPLFPAMFRDRPSPAHPAGNCGLVPCRELDTQDLPGYGSAAGDLLPLTRTGRPAEAWYTGSPVGPRVANRLLRDRARMAQSIDRMVQRILAAVDDNTYVVLTSDNGFHLGQHGLGRGKGTPYDTDVRVPLLVTGPGVVPGPRKEVTSNIDLAPTFEELAGLLPAPYRSGLSLAPTLAQPALVRQSFAFLEHTQQTLTGGDPDAAFSGSELDRIPSYTAVRSRTGLLARFDLDPRKGRTSWSYEFYSYKRDRFERKNAFASPKHRDEVALLMARLAAFDGCREKGDQPVSEACRAVTQ